MKRETYEKCAKRALEYYEKAGIILSDEEKGRIEVVDLGLDEGEDTVNWIRLEIFLKASDSEEPIAMIPIYENNEDYSSFSEYKLSSKEKP